MNRGANDGFKVNTQTHLLPVLATSIKVILGLRTFICYSLYVIYYMLLLIFPVNRYRYMCLVFSYIFSFNDYSMGNMIMRK